MTDAVEFNVALAQMDEQPAVVVAGDVDITTAPRLKSVMLAALDGCGVHLVVDLSATTFIDSAGISALLVAESKARSLGGTVLLRRPSRPVAMAVSALGLDGVLRTTDEGA
jgi:anti-sigma B factor antagonist